LEKSVVAIAERAYAMTLEPENIVEGLSLLQGRLDETVSTGLVLDRARTLMAMGQLDPERAPEYFADSQRLFEECGCRLGLRELDAARERSGQMASAPN
jgi:hypothetical protein